MINIRRSRDLRRVSLWGMQQTMISEYIIDIEYNIIWLSILHWITSSRNDNKEIK